MQRVTRPKGGINEWLHWLPVSVHKKLDCVMRKMFILLIYRGKRVGSLPTENGGGLGLKCVLEADVQEIVTMARRTYET